MTDINFEIIYPGIYVYKNTFKNVGLFLEDAKELQDWQDWYTFGKMQALQIPPLHVPEETFPSIESFYSGDRNPYLATGDLGHIHENEFFMVKEIEDIFYAVTSHFVNQENITSSNWYKNSPSINRYIADNGISENYAMNLHTDFVQTERDWPGKKYLITTTYYLNDNYEGGEIVFKINDNYITYKPKAGDVIVFRSSDPYYHGVKKPLGADRYMIRNFWEYLYDGSPEWLENEKKYGKDKWMEMEQERIKVDRHKHSFEIEALHEQIVSGEHK